MVVLLALTLAGPWSLIDLALDLMARRAAGMDPAHASTSTAEANSTGRARLSRPSAAVLGWHAEPQAVVAEQDETDDLAQDSPAGCWAVLQTGRVILPPLPGRRPLADPDRGAVPRAPIRVPLRC